MPESRGMAFLGSPRARNDKSNKSIIRLRQQNGKFTKVHLRFCKESSMYNVHAWNGDFISIKVTSLLLSVFLCFI